MGATGSKLEKALGDQFPEGERYFGLENFGNTCYCNSVLQVCIWVYMRFNKGHVAIEVAELFFAVISLCAALGFIIYGGRLFVMLRRFPIESRGRQKKLHEVGFVTGICCTCFLIRCIMVAVSAFDKEADIHVLNHPILDLAYYMIVEIVPSALVLFILRKLPPRRVSDQYHPIK